MNGPGALSGALSGALAAILTGGVASRPPQEAGAAASPRAQPAAFPRGRLGWFVSLTILAGLAATAYGLLTRRPVDIAMLALLVALAAVAELVSIYVYVLVTVSVSVAANFAAALVAGVPGAALVSAVIALVHYTRNRPAFYKTAFNWSTHTLAGVAPALLADLLGLPRAAQPLLLMLAPTVAAALAYYAVDTGLIAIAISLQNRARLAGIWREEFRWLLGQYLVLCVLGLFMVAAGLALGPLGLIVFVLPVFMMRYTQQDYIKHTEEGVTELRRLNEELAGANRQLVAAHQSILWQNDELFLILAKILDARDPYVQGHAAQVTEYVAAVAQDMGLPADQQERLRQASLLHDIGKIGIPEQILNSPTALSPDQQSLMQEHPRLGGELLQTSQGLRHLALTVRHHHERWDGSGYPDGLRTKQIPLEARILAVCDAVEAMASDRPYHRAMSLPEIVAELQRCADQQFDPMVVQAFVRVAERRGPGFVVNSARRVTPRSGAGYNDWRPPD